MTDTVDPPEKLWVRLTSAGSPVAYISDPRKDYDNGRPVYEYVRARSTSHDGYVAWCRYISTGIGGITTVEMCNPGALDAFKVYRAPVGSTSPDPEKVAEIRARRNAGVLPWSHLSNPTHRQKLAEETIDYLLAALERKSE